MEIFRKVYCEGKFEGVYQLIFDGVYKWCYIRETMIQDEDEFDYPSLNLGKDRNLIESSEAYNLNLKIKFKEEDLLSS